jgi:uncharacterized Zn-finger protein
MRRPKPLSSGARSGYRAGELSTTARAHMPASLIPHFANDRGVEKIVIGVKEFQCMGARPPFDHPHVYLDMGADSQILCPYCATLFAYDARLAPDATEPAGCLVDPDTGAHAA